MNRKLHEIGFILGFTKAQIIEIDENGKETHSHRVLMNIQRELGNNQIKRKRTIKVRYLEDSQTNKKGTEMWISSSTLSKQRRWNYTPKKG